MPAFWIAGCARARSLARQGATHYHPRCKKRPARVRQLIADGEFLAALGEITLKDDNGEDAAFSNCDVWRFKGGRMAELNAFVIAPKLNS